MTEGPDRVVVEADGGSRGNPGPAGYGALVRDPATGEVLAQTAGTLGTATNNVAEYNGLIAGLRLAAEVAPEAAIEVRMDSRLVIEQMAGRFKIKSPELKVLANEAQSLAPFGTEWSWIPRAENAAADALVNLALDGKPVPPVRARSGAVDEPTAVPGSIAGAEPIGPPGSIAGSVAVPGSGAGAESVAEGGSAVGAESIVVPGVAAGAKSVAGSAIGAESVAEGESAVGAEPVGAPGSAVGAESVGAAGSTAASPSDQPKVARGWGALAEPPTRVLLLRHGETPHTVHKRFSGSGGDDPELNETGHAQARAAAAYLSTVGGVDAVVSSPMRRTGQTAAVVADALGLDVAVSDGWQECSFGEWDGYTFAEVQQKWPDALTAWLGSTVVAPPGGESFEMCAERVESAADAVLASYRGKTVVVVSHVSPIKLTVRSVLEAPLSAVFRMELRPASVTEIHWYGDGQASLQSFNLQPALLP